MATSTRKRGATFLFEKPLVSRLPFEVEQPFSSTFAFPPPKRVKPAATSSSPWRGDDLDEHTCADLADAQSENVEMQEVRQREEVSAADVAVEVDGEKGCSCWLTGGRDRRTGGGGEQEEEGAKELAPTGAAAGNSGPGRALVQLKIDAMFAAPRLAPRDCSARPGQPLESISDTAPPGDAGRAGAARKGERAMDVDAGSGGAAADAGEGEGGGGYASSCYACRGGLGSEGGDVLCAFCDRAACRSCWQKCDACEVPHCSLCLAADYSSQFESYFCPPCYQDRRLASM